MKKSTLLVIFFTFLFINVFAQQIPVHFFGIDYWMQKKYLGPPVIDIGGVVDYPNVQTLVKDAGCTIYRIAGDGYDTYATAIGQDTTDNDYILAMQKVKNVNPKAKFLIQIPFKSGIADTNKMSPSKAYQLVFNIKTKFQFDTLIYYSIGNEWDFYTDSLGNKLYSSAQISNFIKTYAVQIKRADGNARIVAPALSAYGATDKLNKKIMNRLFGSTSDSITGKIIDPGTPANGKYFCDVVDFHVYGGSYGNLKNLNSSNFNTIRNGLINYPVVNFANNLDSLQLLLNAANALRPLNPLTYAVTEMNVCYKNPIVPIVEGVDTTNSTVGIGTRSFFSGQAWADYISSILQSSTIAGNSQPEFFMPWSIYESGGDGDSTDLGMTKGDANDTLAPIPLSTYYHYKLFSDYFKGKYVQGFNNKQPNVKTFASLETGAGFYIMILNRDGVDYDYNIGFNNSYDASSAALKLKFDFTTGAPVPLDSATTYENDTIQKNSTVLLKFSCHGTKLMKKVYTLVDASNDIAPQLRQIGNTVVDGSQLARATISCGHAGGIGGTINSNTTYTNDTVYINSDILLAGHTELTFINCLVVVAQGVKIKSTPQASIVLKKSVMIGCDGKVWKGIEMLGNYLNGERLLIENSSIISANIPIKADRIPDMKITKSIFANGETAVELNRSQAFSITENLAVGYKTGIKTTNTKPNYVSEIKDNRLIDMETAIKFANDGHDKLDVFCNELLYRKKGLESVNTDLKEQGATSMSAGNLFIKSTPGMPLDYIDHSGTATKYYYGPSEIVEFSLPLIANIPILQATADRTCKQAYSIDCDLFIGIEEQNDNLSPQMLIYPNPSTGSFTINFSNLQKGNWTLNIHDVLGRLINNSKVEANQERITLQIKAKGFYFISLQNGNNRISQKVLVE